MTAISDSEFGQQLCKILRLDPSKTRNIVIISKIDSPVIVHVTQFLQEHEANNILKELKDFVKKEDEKESDGETLIRFAHKEKPKRPEFPPPRIT